MDLSNVKINFLGDSITFGSFATTPEQSYVGLFAQNFPNSVVRRYGVGGSCISNGCIWNAKSLCERAVHMDDDADLIVVFGGTNDFGCCVAPGTEADRTEDTFSGACHSLFTILRKKYPTQTIVVLTPLHRIQESLPVAPHGVPYPAPLSHYVSILKDTAAIYHIPVIDLYSTSQVGPEQEKGLMDDGIHPNDQGHQILYQEIRTGLQQILI